MNLVEFEALIYQIIVIAYFATAIFFFLLSAAAYQCMFGDWGQKNQYLFLAVAFSTFLFGMIKDGFLSAGFTWVRGRAWEMGLYSDRQMFQIPFLIGLLLLAGFMVWHLWATEPVIWKKLLQISISLLTGLVIARAVSLHQLDRLFDIRLVGIKVNWIVELALIIVINFISIWALRKVWINKSI